METPSWVEFETRLVGEFDLDSPAAELALVLQRYRTDLDAAARAGAEGRSQGLRMLAEQAVLAIQLEKLLERPGDAGYVLNEELRALKDRMLDLVEAAGLEVVRLRGADGAGVAGLAEIDSWRYDELYAREVVIEELEPAVRHLGVPLRKGRVIMGAPHGGGPRLPDERLDPPAPALHDLPLVAFTTAPGGRERIVCPVSDCGTENEPDAEVCVGCLVQLGGYRRLSRFPQVLFNRGLAAARAGDSHTARDCFAAVVLWLPDDLDARKAYALACLEAHDAAAARRAWEQVLARAPGDPLARRGMHALMRAIMPVPEP